jgi:hypothetical protein
MRSVAAITRLIGVQTHRVHGALRLVVTSHTGGGLSALFPERVAVLARRRLRSMVERRCDRRVAAFAQRGGWLSELAIAVAVCARDLAQVRCVAPAVANIAVGNGHVIRGTVLAARTATACGDRQKDDPAGHRLDPIGWHIRHGIAVSGSLLDQLVGCGLPPTPPTL